MILDEYIEVNITSNTVKRYQSLGYNVKCRDKNVPIKVSDLSPSSTQSIRVRCDYCGSERKIRYADYTKQTNNGETKYACKNCQGKKFKDSLLRTYGVSCTSDIPGVKEKTKQTNIEKYGYESPSQSPLVKEKIKQTNLSKYGATSYASSDEGKKQIRNYWQTNYNVNSPLAVKEIRKKAIETLMSRYGITNPMYNDEIKGKVVKTNRKKYGCDYALQNPEILQKVYATNLQRYGEECLLNLPEVIQQKKEKCLELFGHENPFNSKELQERIQEENIKKYGGISPTCSPEIKAKVRDTMNKNQTCSTSSQQKYLHKLYGGALNYPCSSFSLDIYLLEHQLDIEYNGGGHNLCVQMGSMTQEEFDQKEIIRGRIIRSKGFRQMTIISRNNQLPSDDKLQEMLQETLNFLNSTNHHWVNYDIDHQTVENALGKFPYDFGVLRTKRQFYKELETIKEAS